MGAFSFSDQEFFNQVGLYNLVPGMLSAMLASFALTRHSDKLMMASHISAALTLLSLVYLYVQYESSDRDGILRGMALLGIT